MNLYFRSSVDLPHPLVFIALMLIVLLIGYSIVTMLIRGYNRFRGTPEPSDNDLK